VSGHLGEIAGVSAFVAVDYRSYSPASFTKTNVKGYSAYNSTCPTGSTDTFVKGLGGSGSDNTVQLPNSGYCSP
jgi:hypothetical protein